MGEIVAYARLVVKVGVDVRAGQDVLISGALEQAELVRALAAEAYRAGARHVDAEFRDPWVKRALVADGADDALGYTPPWLVARMEQAKESGAAVIHISAGSNAEVFDGVDMGASRGRACPGSSVRGSTPSTARWSPGRSSAARPTGGRRRRWASRTWTAC